MHKRADYVHKLKHFKYREVVLLWKKIAPLIFEWTIKWGRLAVQESHRYVKEAIVVSRSSGVWVYVSLFSMSDVFHSWMQNIHSVIRKRFFFKWLSPGSCSTEDIQLKTSNIRTKTKTGQLYNQTQSKRKDHEGKLEPMSEITVLSVS